MSTIIDRNNKPIVVDLFSGAGGTGLGFVHAGFQIVGAVENNPYAAATYEHNLDVKVTQTDIKELDPVAFRTELGLEVGQLDVMVGCPPCQGFSRMRNSSGQDDKRNTLVLLYLEFISAFRPRFALFENVYGMTKTEYGRKFLDELCCGLEKLGYALTRQVVDAVNFGVPQHRKRIIVIAGRDGIKPSFPDATHDNPNKAFVALGQAKPWLTVKDAIGNGKYPRLASGESSDIANHKAPLTGSKVLDFIKQVPANGGSRTDAPEEYWLKCHLNHRGHRDVYGRLRWDQPANTITAGCTNPSKGRFVHPDQDRALTPREAAALQGFPDTFEFQGYDIQTQIGNAVPPPLAEALARSLRKTILDASQP